MGNQAERTRDAWIAMRCQLGEAAAFRELVEMLEKSVLYYLKKLMRSEPDALDVLQELWLAVFRNIRRLKAAEALRPWVYRMAHGMAVSRIRREVARDRAEEAAVEGDPGSFEEVDARFVHEALDFLEEHHREALVLHFLEELSLEEIASIVGVPIGTVKSRIHFGKKALKEALARGGYGK